MKSPIRKKVIVTGAATGIGHATARRFAAEGWDVCVNSRREQLLKALVAELPSGSHLVCAGDYSEPDTNERMSRMIEQNWGGVDALVSCAGVSASRDAIDSPLDEWRTAMNTMLIGSMSMSRTAVAQMHHGGRIVHVTSIHSHRAEQGASAYSVAKAGIEQMCRALAVELASRNILVNAIAPGFIDTPMSSSSGVNELETPWFDQNYVTGHHLPLRRAGPARGSGRSRVLSRRRGCVLYYRPNDHR